MVWRHSRPLNHQPLKQFGAHRCYQQRSTGPANKSQNIVGSSRRQLPPVGFPSRLMVPQKAAILNEAGGRCVSTVIYPATKVFTSHCSQQNGIIMICQPEVCAPEWHNVVKFTFRINCANISSFGNCLVCSFLPTSAGAGSPFYSQITKWRHK